MIFGDIRNDYTLAGLDEADLDRDPVRQFDRWMTDAIKAGVFEPTAMTLATATDDGRPHSRIVLLKHFDERGFCFFTNYDSAKGREMAKNPLAALCIHWPPLERQVRIEGAISKTTAAESDGYFQRRPRGSQLGAWISKQSGIIDSRKVLEDALVQITAKFEGRDVTRPPHWGGYRVKPASIEFWQGRQNRLHDRLVYTLQPDGAWKITRLAP